MNFYQVLLKTVTAERGQTESRQKPTKLFTIFCIFKQTQKSSFYL